MAGGGPGDGLLDARALPAPKMLDAAKLALKVKGARHDDIPEVVATRGSRIEIGAEPPIEFNVDGEVVGLKSPATFELVGRVRFLVPQR